jgi:hypothetical protein
VVAIGMGLVFAGYAIAMWGYCLLVGYNVTFAQVFATAWSPTAAAQEESRTPGVQTA